MHKEKLKIRCIFSYFLIASLLFSLQISNIYNSNSFVDAGEYDIYFTHAIFTDSTPNNETGFLDSFSLEFEWDGYSNEYDEDNKIHQLAYILKTTFFEPTMINPKNIVVKLFSSIPIDSLPPEPSPA
jgi:hypothetical protein